MKIVSYKSIEKKGNYIQNELLPCFKSSCPWWVQVQWGTADAVTLGVENVQEGTPNTTLWRRSWRWGLWRDGQERLIVQQVGNSDPLMPRFRSGQVVLCTIWKQCHVAWVGPEPSIILAFAWNTTRIHFSTVALLVDRSHVVTVCVAHRAWGLIWPVF